MTYPLFDLHCDTALDLYVKGVPLASNDLHISLDKAAGYSPYTQVTAIWSEAGKSDGECFSQFLAAKDNFIKEIRLNADKAALCKSYAEVEQARRDNKIAMILAVEDARILEGDISRLDLLYSFGVRFLTLTWKGETCIGGSYDTDTGLTGFGKAVVQRCFELGIIPDISHASEYVADEVARLAKENSLPFVATHSDAYSVHKHRRNLRDRHIEAINERGGLIGVNLCPHHLSGKESDGCGIFDVMRHIDYYLSHGCEDTLALGCDLDGTALPRGFKSVADVYRIADAMAKSGYSEKTIEKVFFYNANEFIKKNLK